MKDTCSLYKKKWLVNISIDFKEKSQLFQSYWLNFIIQPYSYSSQSIQYYFSCYMRERKVGKLKSTTYVLGSWKGVFHSINQQTIRETHKQGGWQVCPFQNTKPSLEVSTCSPFLRCLWFSELNKEETKIDEQSAF